MQSHERQLGRASAPSAARWLWLVVPLLTILAAISLALRRRSARKLPQRSPASRKLTFERVVLDAQGIHVTVRAGGSEPMRIAQVQVDDAYWSFVQVPPGPLGRGAAARLDALPVGSRRGSCRQCRDQHRYHFQPRHSRCRRDTRCRCKATRLAGTSRRICGHTARRDRADAVSLLRGVGTAGMRFLLALTVGLLAFLFVDSFEEALELAGRAAPLRRA